MKSSVRFTKRSEKRSDGTIAIRMRVTWNSNRFDMVLPQRVPEKYWDVKKECCKSSWDDSRIYNRYISSIKNKLDSFFLECDTNKHLPSVDEVKSLFIIQEYSDKELIEYLYERFIDYGTRTRNWSSATVRLHKMVLNLLIEYNPKMRASDLTKEYILNFIESYTIKHQMQSSTAKKMFENLKWFLKWCVDNDLGVPREAIGVRPKFIEVENEPLYLTMEELNSFENVMPDTKAQEQVRDIFVFSCYSGLRYSDVINLKKRDIYNDSINFVTKKTKDSLSVNLNKHTRELIEKYKDYDSEYVFPSRKLGTHDKILKKLAKKAGLNAIVSKTYYVGSTRYEKSAKKYEVMASHVARRTFVTIALTIGIPAEVIMKWTGHKVYDNMKPYIAIVDKLKKQNMQKFDEI